MDVFQSLWQLVLDLWNLLVVLLRLGLQWWLLLVWFGWWTFAVNWRRARSYLAQGGWVPLVLLTLIGAFVWSRLDPTSLSLGFMRVPNFWWQLGAAGVLVSATLLCGWIQGLIGWTPPEIELEPPAHGEHMAGQHH